MGSPNRTRPGLVGSETGYMVHMELWYQITECSYVDLVWIECLFHQARYRAGLLHQLLLLLWRQVVDLPQVGHTGDQNKPGILAVLGQQDTAEGQIPELPGIRQKAGVQFKHEDLVA